MKNVNLIAFLIAILLIGCGNKAESKSDSSEDRTESSYSDSSADKDDNTSVKNNEPVTRLLVVDVMDGTKVLGNQAGNSYGAINLVDGDPATGWAIKLSALPPGTGLIDGPSMNVNAKKIAYVNLKNGYGKNKDSFNKNSRAAWIEIVRMESGDESAPENIIYSGPVKDVMEFQSLPVNNQFDNSRPTGRVRLKFKPYAAGKSNDGYYMGSKWDDLVISEIEFYGVSNAQSGTSKAAQSNFSLKTLIDAFTSGGHNISSLRKNELQAIMQGLGFTQIGSSKTSIEKEDPEGDIYYQPATIYSYKNNEMNLSLYASEYDTHTYVSRFILNFNTQDDCDNFLSLSKQQLGPNFKGIEKNYVWWDTKISGKKVTISIVLDE